MRVGELSEAVDLPVPTIKYYIREGLMPPGETLWSTRSAYDETHVARLRLIRVLTEVGKLSLAEVRAVLRALDDEGDDTTSTAVALAHDALVTRPAPTSRAARLELARARVAVDALVTGLGWRVRPDAASREQLAATLVTLWRNGWPPDATVLARLAPHAEALVADEEGSHLRGTPPAGAAQPAGSQMPGASALTTSLVSTILLEQAFVALRRLALEHCVTSGPRRRTKRSAVGRPPAAGG